MFSFVGTRQVTATSRIVEILDNDEILCDEGIQYALLYQCQGK